MHESIQGNVNNMSMNSCSLSNRCASYSNRRLGRTDSFDTIFVAGLRLFTRAFDLSPWIGKFMGLAICMCTLSLSFTSPFPPYKYTERHDRGQKPQDCVTSDSVFYTRVQQGVKPTWPSYIIMWMLHINSSRFICCCCI